jgi:hypothetical protein
MAGQIDNSFFIRRNGRFQQFLCLKLYIQIKFGSFWALLVGRKASPHCPVCAGVFVRNDFLDDAV